jgi:ATP-dependent DNA helicase RecQ
LTRPVAAPAPSGERIGEIGCDEALFEKLRLFRKRLADERAVPPYIIFSDVALRQMARFYPETPAAFSRISGVGEKKLREFGAAFLTEIAAHLQTNPRQIFAEDTVAAGTGPGRGALSDTVRETLRFFRQDRSIAAIARLRGLKEGTIYSHLEEGILAGEPIAADTLLDDMARREIAAAFARSGFGNLSGAVESLGGRYSYGQLRLYRALAQTHSLP